MALKNTVNNYARIVKEDVNIGFIDVEIFKDQQSRISGVTAFEQKQTKKIFYPIKLDIVPEVGNIKSIKDLIRTQSYLILKANPDFKDWVDC